MFNKFLRRTLPRLEARSVNSGMGFAMFIYEESEGIYFSEKIRISGGEVIYRYIDRVYTNPEESVNIMINKVEGQNQFSVYYHYVRPNKRGSIIIVKVYPEYDLALDCLN